MPIGKMLIAGHPSFVAVQPSEMFTIALVSSICSDHRPRGAKGNFIGPRLTRHSKSLHHGAIPRLGTPKNVPWLRGLSIGAWASVLRVPQ